MAAVRPPTTAAEIAFGDEENIDERADQEKTQAQDPTKDTKSAKNKLLGALKSRK